MPPSEPKRFVPPPKAGAGTTQNPTSPVAHVKATIPKALREQVWITYAGRCFERACLIPWCANTMTVFDFHVGHDKPESEGGATEIRNLRPICARCNLSMGAQYSIQEWSRLSAPVGCVGFGFGFGCRWWASIRRAK
jgi:hypothetical protein